MPLYRWRGIDETGAIRTGTLWAPTYTFLKKSLKQQSIGLIHAVASWEFSRISSRAQDTFFEHLSSLLSSQVPLYQALCLTARLHSSSALKQRIERVAQRIAQGIHLSEALEEQQLSDPLCHALVVVGESTGALGQVLFHYIQYRKQQAHQRTTLYQSLIGPIITLGMFLFISGILLLGIVPLLDSYITTHAISVGTSTRCILWLSRQCSPTAFLVLVGVFFLGTLLVSFLRKTVFGSELFELLLVKTPFVGAFYGKLYTGRTLQTVGMLLEQRVPLAIALHVAVLTVPYMTYQRELQEVMTAVERGMSLEKAWEYARFARGEGRGFIQVGEFCGTLPSMLLCAADHIHKELSSQLSLITRLLNPLLLIILASLIGSLAYSLYMPLLSLSQGLVL